MVDELKQQKQFTKFGWIDENGPAVNTKDSQIDT
jgi:hypothetical protein